MILAWASPFNVGLPRQLKQGTLTSFIWPIEFCSYYNKSIHLITNYVIWAIENAVSPGPPARVCLQPDAAWIQGQRRRRCPCIQATSDCYLHPGAVSSTPGSGAGLIHPRSPVTRSRVRGRQSGRPRTPERFHLPDHLRPFRTPHVRSILTDAGFFTARDIPGTREMAREACNIPPAPVHPRAGGVGSAPFNYQSETYIYIGLTSCDQIDASRPINGN